MSLRSLIAGAALLGLAASTLVATPALAATSAPATRIGFAAEPASVPVVDSQLGVGVRAAAEPARIDVVRSDATPDSALVRVSAFEPGSATDVSVEDAVALRVAESASSSTTVLVPLAADGSFALSASSDVDVRVEPIAFFDDAAAAGAVSSLPRPIARTPDAGAAVSVGGATIGLVGLGGVPSTGVRSVFATLDFATDAAAEVTFDGVTVPVDDGTVISTFLTPTEAGDVVVSGPAGVSVGLTVRGWVAEATQSESTAPANLAGSVVPAIGAKTALLDLSDAASASVDLGSVADGNLALALVWGSGADDVTTIYPGSARVGRATGALVDEERGAQPQLLMIDPADPRLSVRRGDVDASSRVIAGVAGVEAGKARELAVEIGSPAAGQRIDLTDAGGTLELAGTVSAPGGDIATIEVRADGELIGSPAVRYSDAGIHWSYLTSAPRSGTFTFDVTVTDRSGARDSATVEVTIELPDAADTVVVDNVQILDDPSASAVRGLTDDTVTLACALEVGPGDYLVAGSIPGAPSGFLRRVIAVDEGVDGTVVHTEPAVLTDIIVQTSTDADVTLGGDSDTIEELPVPADMDEAPGDLPLAWMSDDVVDTSGLADVDGDADVSDDASPSLAVDGAADAAAVAEPRVARAGLVSRAALSGELSTSKSVNVSSKYTLGLDSGKTLDLSRTDGKKAKSDVKVSGGAYVEMKAKVTSALSLGIEVRFEPRWGLPKVSADFRSAFTTSAELEHTVGVYLKATAGSKSFNELRRSIAKLKLTPVTVPVGPVPVVVVPEIELGVRGKITASASVEYTQKLTTEKISGVECTDGVCKRLDPKPKSDKATPVVSAYEDEYRGSGTLNAEVGPEFSASAMLYGSAGLEVAIALKAGGELTLEGSDSGKVGVSFELYLKAGAGVSIKVQVPVVDMTIIDWEFASVELKISILKARLEISKTKDPTSPPSSGASSGSTGTPPAPGGGSGSPRDAIDVMFVIDTTGSMGGIIDATVAKARDIATKLTTSAKSARVGLVEYRDYGDEYMARTVSPLSSDIGAFGAGLDTLYAGGGGDWPEAVYSGIVTALSEDWRATAARAVIVMGDAPAHDPEYHTGYTGDQVAGFVTDARSICQNGGGNIIGGPDLPECAGATTSSLRTSTAPAEATLASFRSAPSRAMAVAPVVADPGAFPVIVFGISTNPTLTSQLTPLAEATGGTVADIDGSDAVGDAIDEALVSAGSAPQAHFAWSAAGAELTVDAAATIVEGDGATYTFDFGDGTTPVSGGDASETHTYAAPGTYTVSMTVTDSAGRTGQAQTAVTVADDSEPIWRDIVVTPSTTTAFIGEVVAFSASGLTPGSRVSVAWDGAATSATGVVSSTGVVELSLAIPDDASLGERGFTLRALDDRRVGTGTIGVTPAPLVCSST